MRSCGHHAAVVPALDLRNFRRKAPNSDRLDQDLGAFDEDQGVRVVPR
jgi:hypothetical protein